MWALLCPPTNTTTISSSCNRNTNSLPGHQIYQDMTQGYRFGISPTGYGYDCCRTYEMLLLGIIPVVEERIPESYQLFDGLPVVHMPNMKEATSIHDFINAIQSYMDSDAFQKTDFEQGWRPLFLDSRRRELLRDAEREEDILNDGYGDEYYQGFRYSLPGISRDDLAPVFCIITRWVG
jgi:hypothetical protein